MMGGDMMDMMDGVMGGGSGFGLMGMLINLLLLVGLLAVIVWVVVRVLPAQRAQGERSEGRANSAEEILRGRFARGEIEAEEYERFLRVLRGEPAQSNYGLRAGSQGAEDVRAAP